MGVLGTEYLIYENQLGSSTMNIDGIFINTSLAVNKGEISMLSPDLKHGQMKKWFRDKRPKR